ncbi:uncharacterized protein [Montipora foliosa]|uniref:uncharacterized protein n=1 Tax=Montipora foliosa TaxID=591990 RepID=UPI0035F14D13
MAERNIQDEITRLRLKLLKQKMKSEPSGASSSGHMAAYVSPSNRRTGIQERLEAETLKSQQLLERVKEERQRQKKPTFSRNEDHTREMMMMMMMSQNMQMQQMMLQQMMSSSTATGLQTSEKPAHNNVNSSSAFKPLEIEQIGHREMTPFTSQTQRIDPQPPVSRPTEPVSAQRKPLTRTAIRRGVATPVRPTERVPEPRPKPHASVNTGGFIGQVVRGNPVAPYPFPGPRGARKLRHYGYASWACFILISLLRKRQEKRLEAMEQLNGVINQAIDELHSKHYLDRDGAIYALLQDATQEDGLDLKIKNPGVFQRLSQESQAAIRELSSIVENLVDNIVQINPSNGLLSATREGVLWEMTQVGVLLPQDYLWQVEEENITFGAHGELVQVTKQISAVLFLGLFVSRGLVSTLLLKPAEYGVMETAPSDLASSNLKVLASILMKIVREVSLLQKNKIMPLASEISSQVFSDEDMKYIYKKIDDSINWSKASLKEWAEAFVDALDRS